MMPVPPYRRWLFVLTPLAVGSVVPAALVSGVRDRLPAVASDTGNGPLPMEWAVVAIGPAVVMACVFIVVGTHLHLRGRSPRQLAVSAATTWPAGVAAVGWTVGVVVRHLDRTAPGPEPWWVTTPSVQIGLIALSGLAWWAAGRGPALPVAQSRPAPWAPRMRLTSDERVLWTRSVFSWAALFSTTGLVIIAGVNLAAGSVLNQLVVLWVVPAAVWSILGAWARVQIDGRRVAVVQPLLRRTLTAVDLEHVVDARTRLIQSGQYGNPDVGVVDWGGTFGYRAYPNGEVLSLRLTDNREFVVGIDDAGTVAALVNSLLDRREGGPDAHPDRSDVHRPAR